MSTNFVLILNCIRRPLLQFQSVLQILLGVDLIAAFILEHEGEVPDDPQEGGEAAGVLAGLAVGLGLDILGEVDYEVEGVECVFVDAADGVVDEEGAEEEREEEDPGVMVGVFVHASEALGVDHYDVHVLIGRAGDGLLPQPQSLRAGVDRRAHLKPALLLLQQHSVHEEAFASAVLPHDRNDSQLALLRQ